MLYNIAKVNSKISNFKLCAIAISTTSRYQLISTSCNRYNSLELNDIGSNYNSKNQFKLKYTTG